MKIFFIMRMLLPLLVLSLIEYYAFQSVFTWCKTLKPPYKQIVMAIYGLLTIGTFVSLFAIPMWRGNTDYPNAKAILSVMLMAVIISKLAMAIFLCMDDIRRLIQYGFQLFMPKKYVTDGITNAITRSAFMQKTALLAGGTFFSAIIYGMRNRYNYKVHTVAIPIANIPEALKKLRIVQISDIHSGSFTNLQAVEAGITKILELKPDLIFFTGDLVNNKATEMLPYIEVFSKLKAPYGVYSTLGNHDYGDYYDWKSPRDKVNNLNHLKSIHHQLGWNLLLNENRILNINNLDLAIIGVENISGSNKFHSYGNFEKACVGTENITHKILLSHDPSHWDKEVKNSDSNIMLTLSGHTHGMQFGIDIPGFKWSPVQYIYKKWAGLYTENDRNLYVNRGFGFLGYSGRVGILPEITAIKFV
jgi:uncharacterized protein